MQITTRKIVERAETVVADCICNRCGESCVVRATSGGHTWGFGGLRASVTGGYSHTFPPDLERWTFDLCQDCLGWLVAQLKLPPDRFDEIDGEPIGGESPVILAVKTGNLQELSSHAAERVVAARSKVSV